MSLRSLVLTYVTFIVKNHSTAFRSIQHYAKCKQIQMWNCADFDTMYVCCIPAEG